MEAAKHMFSLISYATRLVNTILNLYRDLPWPFLNIFAINRLFDFIYSFYTLLLKNELWKHVDEAGSIVRREVSQKINLPAITKQV